jgi:NADPH-ferrihemoprotein reductase
VAVFGLGNRNYPRFAQAGKTMESLLMRVGCEVMAPRGDGDDDGNIEVDFDDWVVDLLAGMDRLYTKVGGYRVDVGG